MRRHIRYLLIGLGSMAITLLVMAFFVGAMVGLYWFATNYTVWSYVALFVIAAYLIGRNFDEQEKRLTETDESGTV